MKKIVRKSYFKKLLFTILIVLVSGWFVYAGDFHNNFFPQVKIVKCYPNPAISVINFEFGAVDKSSTLQVYSFTGKKMTDQPLSSNKLTVMLGNDFYRGIYIFQLRDKSGKIIETGKFQVIK